MHAQSKDVVDPPPAVLRLVRSIDDDRWLRRAGLGSLVVALLLRVGWALAVPVMPLSDSHAYDVFAQNIAAGHGYGWKPGELTAYWAVGTSAVYALLYKVFGHGYLPIVVLNIGIGVASVWLAMALAQRWLGRLAAVLTGWLLALWPLLIQYTTVLASELLFNFGILAALWLAAMPGWTWWSRSVTAGVAFAVSCYIRPVALLMPPLAFMREALVDGRWIRGGVACLACCVVMIMLILPWSFRNLQVFDRFVLISTNAGANFWMGNNPQTTGAYVSLPETGIVNEVDRDRYFSRQAREYIRQAPVAFVLRTLKKAVQLHERESIGVSWNEQGLEQRFGHRILLPLKLVSSGYWWLVLASAGVGTVLYLRHRGWRDALLLPPLIAWGYFTVVHSITVIGDRYHMPSIPFIAMLAAYGLAALVPFLAGRYAQAAKASA